MRINLHELAGSLSRAAFVRRCKERGYLLTEALVYIGVVFVLLGVGYMALYRCIDSSVVLRRNADDVSAALHAGERWRADIRAATQPIISRTTNDSLVLQLRGARGQVDYRFAEGVLDRRVGEGPWVRLMRNAKSCVMRAEARPNVSAWVWELELQPQAKASVKASRIRPLFTFLAVPQTTPAQ
jgi:hypothetical protein